MKQGLLAIAALLGATTVTAQAEYIRFIYNPGVAKKDAPQFAGLPGQPGVSGTAGAAGGIPPAILNQIPPAMRQQIMQMPPAQQQQLLRQYMSQAGAGGPAMGSSEGGPPMDLGGGSGRATGGMRRGNTGAQQGSIYGNAPNAGPGMGLGLGGGAPGVMGGMPGMPGMPGSTDPNLQPEEEFDLGVIKLELVVESSKVEVWKEMNNQAYKVLHKWGLSAVDPNDLKDRDITVQRIMEVDNRGRARPMPTVKSRWDAKIEEYKKKKGFPTPELILELADFALTHAMQEQFDQQLTELVKLKPDHPSAQAYKKYTTVDFKRTNLKDDPAASWSDKLGDFRVKNTQHFLIRYDTDCKAEVVQSYEKLLESNYRAFFSWFALKGKYLPTPEYRLVAVLSEKSDEFNALQKVFETIALPADAFMSRRDNLSVMSGTPLSDGYDSLHKTSQPLWVEQGWNPELCLKGDYRARRGQNSVQDISYAHTMALMLRGVEEQSERQAVSHVGTLQLATASGLLPRTVTAPHWVQYGIGSFFETPFEAYWPGTGAPHWNYLTRFQLWKDAKKLDKPDEALRKVVTDAYFHEAHADHEARTDHDKDAILKARTMTWSLTYFLAQQYLDQLLRYYQELAAMPRDMELGEDALAALFVKAFDLGEGSAGIGSAKAKDLARKWYEYMSRDTHLEVAQVLALAKKREEARVKKLQEIAAAKKAEAEAMAAARAANLQSLQPGQLPNVGGGYPGGANPPDSSGQQFPQPGKFGRGAGTAGDR